MSSIRFGRGDFKAFCTKIDRVFNKPCVKCELLSFCPDAILYAYPQYMMPFEKTAPHKKEIPSPEIPNRTVGDFNVYVLYPAFV